MATDPAPPFGALLRSLPAGRRADPGGAGRAGRPERARHQRPGARRSGGCPYPHTVRRLARALRLSAADRARLEAAVPRRAAAPAPLAGRARPPTNLPAPLTSFVGRERELAEVAAAAGRRRGC